MHIGLIGGLAPAGTVVYYRTLCRLHAEAGRKLALTITQADFPEMAINLGAGNVEAQAAIFAGHIDRLKAGGCQAVALASIGGHFCLDALTPLSSLPIITAVDAFDAYFAAQGIARVGVLGARNVMESGLYGASAAEIVVPPAEQFDLVHSTYMQMAAVGRATPEERRFFADVARGLREDRGVDAILLGGADLSLAFEGHDGGFPLIDAAEVHAEAIARFALAN